MQARVPTSSTAAVSLKDVGLAFLARAGQKQTEVLRDFSLDVRSGEFVAIVGPSGCGKTTLLRLVGGLIAASSPNCRIEGRILVEGRTPQEALERKRLGFGFQNPVLLPWRTIRQNVVLPFELSTRPRHEEWDAVDAVLDLVGVAEFANGYPYQLSGGMQQRVNIARALVHDPPVLLLDEPFGSLDEVTRERLDFALRDIQQAKGATVLFVTHSLNEAVLTADRMVVMSPRPSQVAQVIESSLGPDRSQGVQTTSTFAADVEELRQALFSQGV